MAVLNSDSMFAQEVATCQPFYWLRKHMAEFFGVSKQVGLESLASACDHNHCALLKEVAITEDLANCMEHRQQSFLHSADRLNANLAAMALTIPMITESMDKVK